MQAIYKMVRSVSLEKVNHEQNADMPAVAK